MRFVTGVGALVLGATVLSGCVTTTTPQSQRSQQGLRITYKIEDTTSTPTAIRTEVVETASPYLASDLNYDGGNTNAPLTGGFLYTREALYTVGEDGSVQTTQLVPPDPAPPAAHLDVALPLAEQQKLAVHDTARPAGSYLGRSCTWWATHDPLDGAEFQAPTKTDHVDSCVDNQGLVLKEQWYISGKLARTRTALAIDVVPAVATADLFNGHSPAPVPDGIASDAIVDIVPGAQSQGIVIGAPKGFSLDRAVSIASAVPGEPITQIASIGEADAYRKGPDVMVFRRIRNLTGDALSADKGAPVDLGVLGMGHLLPVSTGCEVSVVTKDGVLVTADSTGDPQALIDWVKTAKLVAPSPAPTTSS